VSDQSTANGGTTRPVEGAGRVMAFPDDGLITVRSRHDNRLRRRLARRVVRSWLAWMLIVAIDWAGLSHIARHHPAAITAIHLGVVIGAGYITMEKAQEFGRTLGWWS